MKYLVYGILGDDFPAEALPPGPCAAAVRLSQAEGLAAAWSAVPDFLARPEVSHLLAYAAVVEALHCRAGVLPVRFGCLLDSEAAVADLLRLRQEPFRTALARVAGCVEMTVRLRGEDGATLALRGPVLPLPSSPSSPATGTAYLARRREAFAAEDACRHRTAQAGERLRQALGDRTVGFLAEPPGRGTALPAFHFLVRRADQAAFVEAFCRLPAAGAGRLLLTGPWPPYHFTDPPASGGRQPPVFGSKQGADAPRSPSGPEGARERQP
jgi:hypothetical protein